MIADLATSSNIILNTSNRRHDAISKICHQLFMQTPIRYFDYTRYYDSGEMVACSTHPYFTSRYYGDGLYPSFEERELFRSFGLEVTFLPHNMPLPPGAYDLNPDKYDGNIATAADSHIFHRLYYVKRHGDYYVTSGFGVMQELKSILHFYLNA